MNFIRKHKKQSIIFGICLLLFLLFGMTYARYLYNIVDNYILESKGFYFNSSVLSINNKGYKINNWDGVNSYTLTVDVSNKKNENKGTTADIEYEISVECSEGVTCTVSKDSGIIYQSRKVDTYQIIVTPKNNFYEGDEVVVKTKAMSTSPYKKTLAGTYTLGVEKSKFSYSIEDSKNAHYLLLNLTNSIGYYEVEKAFGKYQIGDQISMDVYTTLTTEEKSNCFSAKVTLLFSPTVLALDMTSSTYLKKLTGSEKTVSIQGHSYVSEYTFKVDANSSEKVLFYKNDMSQDYTYPIVNDSSIVQVKVEAAE